MVDPDKGGKAPAAHGRQSSNRNEKVPAEIKEAIEVKFRIYGHKFLFDGFINDFRGIYTFYDFYHSSLSLSSTHKIVSDICQLCVQCRQWSDVQFHILCPDKY